MDRELPGAIARNSSLFTLAKTSYEKVNDAYGLITLSLVEVRYKGRRGEDTTATIDDALEIMRTHHDQLSPEQAAFAYLRFGELLLDPRRSQEARILEDAMRLYDRAGSRPLHMVVRSFMRSTESKATSPDITSESDLDPTISRPADPLRLEYALSIC